MDQATQLLAFATAAIAFTAAVFGFLWRFVVRPVRGLVDDVAELKHEVAPNGDEDEDGRTLRKIVRAQGKEITQITGQLGRGEQRFRRIEDHIGLPHDYPQGWH